MNPQTITPAALAVVIWDESEGYSRSRGARRIRRVARELFPTQAPGKGGEWHFTAAQVAEICRSV